MPKGVYPRKAGVKRGPYHRGKGKQHRKKKGADEHIIGGLDDAFDWLREQGIDFLPASVRLEVNEIKKRR
jgi:hypothetical protein